jgi:hypothetical protein
VCVCWRIFLIPFVLAATLLLPKSFAGEIFEAHIFAALTQSTQQVILIGDHKQLRPKVHKRPFMPSYYVNLLFLHRYYSVIISSFLRLSTS